MGTGCAARWGSGFAAHRHPTNTTGL